jgi:hypothetical protein
MVRLVIVAATILMVGIPHTFAQDPRRGGTSQQQQACSKDVSRHCRSVMKESDDVIASCLREHHAKLSKACVKAMAQ